MTSPMARPDTDSGRARSSTWRHRGGELSLERPLIMAVVNVTPDSFSDGGRFMAEGHTRPSVSVALRQCRTWMRQGAHILDVGGESTRPGAPAVDTSVELQRILPVIDAVRRDAETQGAVLSVDTRHAAVAKRALAQGAELINDISGLADPAMPEVIAQMGAGVVIGHMRGTPVDMQDGIEFESMLDEVGSELEHSIGRAKAGGVEPEQIVVDPCIGFGKTADQSAALVAAGGYLAERLGFPVLMGASRKSFLGAITQRPIRERTLPSVVCAVLSVERGASIVRVHDVAETAQALRVWAAVDRCFAAERGRVRG